MFWRKKSKEEFVPWYRKRGYKDNLTEEEKRELDSFRWLAQQPEGKHPSAEYSELPEEVQSYISKLQIELHDERGTLLMGRVLFSCIIGVYLVASYFGWRPYNNEGSLWSLCFGIFLIVIPWVYYFREERKLRNDLLNSTEKIRAEWELDYIVSKKLKSNDDKS